MKIKKGVCPVCSQPVVVIPNGILAIVCKHKLAQQQESPVHLCMDSNDPENYLIKPHTANGWVCKGVNCIPEQLLE